MLFSSFWLNSYITDVLGSNGTVNGVVLENLRERVEVSARVIIDATGDGDIAAAAGASRHPLVVQKIFHTVPFPPPSTSPIKYCRATNGCWG